jgi:hypothetical protein
MIEEKSYPLLLTPSTSSLPTSHPTSATRISPVSTTASNFLSSLQKRIFKSL